MTTTSGTYSYNPALSDLVIDAFERIGIRAAEITPDHMISARRSINLIQSLFSNYGVNLFTVVLERIPLVQGVATYSVPSDTIMFLDGYIRTYPLGQAVNLIPQFATTINSTTVTVTQLSNGLVAGNYINIVIPVSIGGIILYGFYQATSVPNENTYTITAASAATSSATGGVVPLFACAVSSNIITVTLPSHGYLSGQSFVVQVSTTLGGITLFGSYTITSVVDANNFTIQSGYPASTLASVYENNGSCQIATQNITTQLVDRVVGPMSRTDYNSLPNKMQQGFPTIFWYSRLDNPTVTLWQVPDGNGPYELQYYRSQQIQDSNPINGQTAAIPNRFLEALFAGTAYHLAMKWAFDRAPVLKAYYDQVWAAIQAEDREDVPLRLVPDLSSYFQG